MQTLIIKVDESYVEQVLNFLQKIPDNKKEIFQHKTIKTEKNDDFLTLLKNGPTIPKKELKEWEQHIQKGYKSWKIPEF